MTEIMDPTTDDHGRVPSAPGTPRTSTWTRSGRYRFGWSDSDAAGSIAQRGLTPDVVANISALKSEPQWMLDLRLKGLRLFERKPLPAWGAELDDIDFDNIKYFVRSTEKQAASWDDLPADIKNTYDKLGIPEAEKARLVSGVAAQYESEVVYHKINEELEKQGVIFLDTDTALKEHPELFREYFAHRHPGRGQQVLRAEHARSGPAAPSSTSPRACTSRSRCRPTSGSTPRTWASSSGP